MKKTIFDTTTEDLDGSNTRPLDQDTNHEANSAVEDAQDCIQAAADLSWLDEDLPDLRTVAHEYFDLATEFDISLYLDVLADEATKGISTLTTTDKGSKSSTTVLSSQMNQDASTMAPQDSVWDD